MADRLHVWLAGGAEFDEALPPEVARTSGASVYLGCFGFGRLRHRWRKHGGEIERECDR